VSMTSEIHREHRVRLDREGYREFKMKILERDDWKCQHCGRRNELEIHHLVRRSQSGADCEENLIVLCSGCHRWLHAGGLWAFDQQHGQAPVATMR